MSSFPTRLIAIALTSKAQKIEAASATTSPKSTCATPNSASVIAAPATAFGSRIAVSIDTRRSTGACRFHASAAATLPHIASFMSIGCSAFATKCPARYCSIARDLVDFVLAEPVGRQPDGPEHQRDGHRHRERDELDARARNRQAVRRRGRPRAEIGRRCSNGSWTPRRRGIAKSSASRRAATRDAAIDWRCSELSEERSRPSNDCVEDARVLSGACATLCAHTHLVGSSRDEITRRSS